MAGEIRGRRNSSTQLLEELETLSESLYKPTATATRGRRTNSLALPRDAIPTVSSTDPIIPAKIEVQHEKPRSRRLSMSPFRSRPKLDDESEPKERTKVSSREEIRADDKANSTGKKGIWNWKPIRAITHIGMQKLSCLFSVEVVTVQGLPASMNGLRLSVCVRKKETKDGAVQTMPARVLQGAADFEETLFIRCHVYCTGTGKQLKFEPRPFLIYAFAIDAEELDFGKNTVDLSLLVQESMAKNLEGARVRQWDTSYFLYGKAKGGELVLKLGFQIMEKDGGIGIYSQAEGVKSGKGGDASSSVARKQSKSSFSVPSPRMSARNEASTPSQTWAPVDLRGIDDLNLDEPAPVRSTASSVQKPEEPESKIEEVDFPEFEVEDKGVEVQDKTDDDEGDSEHATDERSVSSEVVKEVVQDQGHLRRLTELDSIAQQIKALESMMGDENSVKSEGTESERLDADEENVTMEFLQMLEKEGEKKKRRHEDASSVKSEGTEEAAEGMVFLPDLGKGLGSVVQTKDGGYLAAVNPFNVEVPRKETPKLAMQLSRPLILPTQTSVSGFEVFQKMAAVGIDELTTQILSSMPIDEVLGKTAEQIAFEGIASAIIQGRSKEGASSTAARTIEAVKAMACAMSTARKERISTGIWNIQEEPVTLDEILAFTMQKIEAMAVEALKIQADVAEEDAPFDISPLVGKDSNRPLTDAVPVDEWLRSDSASIKGTEQEDQATVTLSVLVQLRDPMRRYEAVGCPVIVLIQATTAEDTQRKGDDEEKFKVSSLHIGGLKVSTGGKRHVWDAEKQRLTAMQWLVAYGLAKAGKKGKHSQAKGPDRLWSISSRVMADMWLKSMRNPDVIKVSQAIRGSS